MRPEELKKKIRGIVNILVTPFDENAQVDYKALKTNVDFLVQSLKQKDSVIVTLGSTSEFYALNDEEAKKIAKVVVDQVNGEIPVLVGTARAGTEPAIEMSQYAQKIGADGVMVVSPYYHMPSKKGIIRHFTRIANSLDIGVMIYNNPSTSKIWIDPNTMKELAEVDNIIACKENTTNMGKLYSMLNTVPKEKMVFVPGIGELYYSFIVNYGCPGFVSSTISNFSPELAYDVYTAGKNKDFGKLKIAVEKIMIWNKAMLEVSANRNIPTVFSPSITPIEHPIYIDCIKESMKLVGLPGGKPRDPMDTLTEAEKELFKNTLKSMGIL